MLERAMVTFSSYVVGAGCVTLGTADEENTAEEE